MGKLTLTKYLFYYNTIVLHKSTQDTLSFLLFYHSPFSSIVLLALRWMTWQEEGSLFIGQGGSLKRPLIREGLSCNFQKCSGHPKKM